MSEDNLNVYRKGTTGSYVRMMAKKLESLFHDKKIDNTKVFRKANTGSYVRMMAKSLESLFDDEKIANVDLISMDDHTIGSHRHVLAACSAYFRAMFKSGMIESRERTIHITNIKGHCLRTLITYCYAGVLEVTLKNVEELLVAAEILQIQQAVADCVCFMAQHLTPYNCVGVMLFAEQHSCFELLDQAEKFVEKRFLEVYKAEEFLFLPQDHLVRLLNSNDLEVESEEDVFNAMLRWISHKRCERREEFFALLKNCIRLRLLPPMFLHDSVWPAMRSLGEKYSEVAEKSGCELVLRSQMVQDVAIINPRKWADSELVAVSTRNSQIFFDKYSPVTKTWTALGQMPLKFADFTAAIFGDQVILTGGSKVRYDSVTSFTFGFNMQTRRYTVFYPMISPRASHGVAVVNGQMYAVGGFHGISLLETVERYDADKKRWCFIPNMSTARVLPAVAGMGGRLYVVGGHNGKYQLCSTEYYDVAANRWYDFCPTNHARRDISLTACYDYLYLMSRELGSRSCTVERYDPETDIWTVMSILSYPHYGLRTVYLQGSLMIGAVINQEIERWNVSHCLSMVKIKLNTRGRLRDLLTIPRFF